MARHGGMTKYDQHIRCDFIAHAETVLINYLLSHNYPPTVIGILKAACVICHNYVQSLNETKHGDQLYNRFGVRTPL